MSPEEKSYLSDQFKNLNEKIDLVITPVKEDVTEVKGKVDDHANRITTLENFKEGHQETHANNKSDKRFRWEILAGSGIIGAFLTWLKVGQ